MAISDRLSNIRQLLPGTRAPSEDERLLRLYWNRAELKKELSRLQAEHHKLLARIEEQEAATARAEEQLGQLEDHLGDPEVATHALAYFQLRALWRVSASRVARFARQLRTQQEERERRRLTIEFDQRRREDMASFDRRLAEARGAADVLEVNVKLMDTKLAGMRGFWNYFRRRRYAESLAAERAKLDEALTLVTDLGDDRANVEDRRPPEFPGISVDGRRIVNTAIIAYAQQLAVALTPGGVALLAKETTSKRVFDVKYGSREDCVRLMAALRDALALVDTDKEDLTGLKERTDALRSAANYRSDADTIPLTDSIGTLPLPASPVSGLETANRAGINVLVDDYWDLYRALLQ